MSFEMISAMNEILSNPDRVRESARGGDRRRNRDRRGQHGEDSSEEKPNRSHQPLRPLPAETLATLRLSTLRVARNSAPVPENGTLRKKTRLQIHSLYIQGSSFTRWSTHRPDEVNTEV